MRIAIVEDEAPIREGMKKILTKIDSSYVVTGTARNGLEGLDLIRRTRPDLVIMDIQMPDMDGLTMLEQVREEKIPCMALVLTAYSDFGYAQKAIELGIENYLLKPIKIPELTKTLSQIEEKLVRVQRQPDEYTLGQIIRESIMGQLQFTDELKQYTRRTFKFSPEDNQLLFLIWLGQDYEQEKQKVQNVLEQVGQKQGYGYHVLDMASRQMMVAVIYEYGKEELVYQQFQRQVMPALENCTGDHMICVMKRAQGLSTLNENMQIMLDSMDWNLLFQKGVIISNEKISATNTLPLAYPAELENQAKQALVNRQKLTFGEMVREFCDRCREQLHQPSEIKEACIRFCMGVQQTAKEYGYLKEEESGQSILQVITKAVEWDEIYHAFEILFHQIMAKEETQDQTSALIKKARKIMEEQYTKGLTLEELAAQLYVSDEYLSMQFKKETGSTFSETIRKMRMEKVKDLLIHSRLKLGQIAELAGYADPKYMSRVFKEEVGMLPLDYRKMH